MAAPTALAWLALSIGTLSARPNIGIMRILTRSTYARYSLRHLMIPALLVPPVMSWLLLSEDHRFLYFPGFGAAVLAVLGVIALTLIIWRTVAGLDELEAREKRAEHARQRAKEMAQQGLLTDAEFEQIKARILADL